jgi:ribose transport system permease protein
MLARLRLTAPREPWSPLLGVVLIGGVALSVLSKDFLTGFNIYVILSHASLLCIIGFSQMTALGVGEFSLAVGGIGELTGVVVGFLLSTKGVPLAPALICGLLFASALGFANGAIVAISGVSGFVITLATGGLFTGAALAITQTAAYANLPPALDLYGTGRFGFLPYVSSATVVVAVGLAVQYRWRRSGRLMLAVGGNPEAAAFSGLSKERAVIWGHTLSGLLAGVAGMVAMAQLHQANPLAGVDWLIQSFTIPIIGGASLSGGSVSVIGVLVAGLILSTISDALILLQVNPYWVTLIEGVLVFLAVMLGRGESFETYRRFLPRRRSSMARGASER